MVKYRHAMTRACHSLRGLAHHRLDCHCVLRDVAFVSMLYLDRLAQCKDLPSFCVSFQRVSVVLQVCGVPAGCWWIPLAAVVMLASPLLLTAFAAKAAAPSHTPRASKHHPCIGNLCQLRHSLCKTASFWCAQGAAQLPTYAAHCLALVPNKIDQSAGVSYGDGMHAAVALIVSLAVCQQGRRKSCPVDAPC